MLFYLDNWQSADPAAQDRMMEARRRRGARFGFGMPPQPQNAQRPIDPRASQAKRGLNENYGRELMELHTLGVDGGYTQEDVIDVARAFTGWTIDQPRQGGGFRFEPRLHDGGEKIVLGHRIKAGGGQSDGEQVLDILAASSVHGTLHRDQAGAPLRGGHAAAGARRSRGSALPRDGRRHPRGRAHDSHLAGVLRADALPRQSEDAVRIRRLAVRATGAGVDDATPLRAGGAQLGMPLYMCQPPTGYADTRRRVGQHRRAAQSHELRAATAERQGCVASGRTSPAGEVLAGDVLVHHRDHREGGYPGRSQR